MKDVFAVIGGTGLTQMEGVECIEKITQRTPFGSTSDDVVLSKINHAKGYFLARHGHPHKFAPHLINYRANIWALKQLGVTKIIAVNAVGGINTDFKTGDIVIPKDIIDYTYGREHTYFDAHVEHIDFSEPYDLEIGEQLFTSGNRLFPLSVHHEGIYGCTQGPRLETPAEIRRLERDGCDVVGMTAMPEAALAQELGIKYASLCLIVNPAAGKGSKKITLEDIHAVIEKGMRNVQLVISDFMSHQACR